jgi:hypothetical protein
MSVFCGEKIHAEAVSAASARNFSKALTVCRYRTMPGVSTAPSRTMTAQPG